jgi:hypothetical protein
MLGQSTPEGNRYDGDSESGGLRDVSERHHGRVGTQTAPRPDDACMGQTRSWVARACLDVLPMIGRDRVLLGRRTHAPREDEWWLFGGKWPWGAAPRPALIELVRAELGLSISADRFQELPYRSLAWSTRRESPQADGAHDISHPFAVTLSKEELAVVHTHFFAGRNPEHSALRQWSLRELMAEYGGSDPLVGIVEDAVPGLETP